MLQELAIRNFALLEAVQIPFGAGLNVLTGETGAGKSIIIDALGAVLGGRITTEAIRTGSDRALVEAIFALPGRRGRSPAAAAGRTRSGGLPGRRLPRSRRERPGRRSGRGRRAGVDPGPRAEPQRAQRGPGQRAHGARLHSGPDRGPAGGHPRAARAPLPPPPRGAARPARPLRGPAAPAQRAGGPGQGVAGGARGVALAAAGRAGGRAADRPALLSDRGDRQRAPAAGRGGDPPAGAHPAGERRAPGRAGDGGAPGPQRGRGRHPGGARPAGQRRA